MIAVTMTMHHYKKEMAKYRNAVKDGLIDINSDGDYKFCDPEYWLDLANDMKKVQRLFTWVLYIIPNGVRKPNSYAITSNGGCRGS